MESSPRSTEATDGASRRELEKTWQHERRWVAAVLLAHMDARDDLEDLLQEVALAFVQHVSELRDPTKLRPWLRTIARNTARGAGRRESRRRRIQKPLGEEAHELPDPSPERERSAEEARSACKRVMERIQDFKPEYREPLLLRCVQGFSQRRIAEVLGLPETTVETRLARARRRLREVMKLDPEGIGGPRGFGGA